MSEQNSLDNVVVLAELFQDGDLTDGRRGHTLVLGLETDLLERDDRSIMDIARLVDDTVGS